jgi:hypothetical protein
LISGYCKTNLTDKRQEGIIKKQSKLNKITPVIEENWAGDTVALKIMSKTETVSISLSILNWLTLLMIIQVEAREHQLL